MVGQVPLNALRGRSDFYVAWNALRIGGAVLGLDAFDSGLAL